MKRVKTEAGFCEPETKLTKLRDFAREQVENFEQTRMKEAMSITMSLFQRNIGVSMTQSSFMRKLEGFIEIKKKHSCSKCNAGCCTVPDVCKALILMHDSHVRRNDDPTIRREMNPYKELYDRWGALSPTVLEQKQCFQLLADVGFLKKQVNLNFMTSVSGKQNWKWLHLEKDPASMGKFEW